MMKDEWQRRESDGKFLTEPTRSLQSNLVLTPLTP